MERRRCSLLLGATLAAFCLAPATAAPGAAFNTSFPAPPSPPAGWFRARASW
jgi:hypothetical protein